MFISVADRSVASRGRTYLLTFFNFLIKSFHLALGVQHFIFEGSVNVLRWQFDSRSLMQQNHILLNIVVVNKLVPTLPTMQLNGRHGVRGVILAAASVASSSDVLNVLVFSRLTPTRVTSHEDLRFETFYAAALQHVHTLIICFTLNITQIY